MKLTRRKLIVGGALLGGGLVLGVALTRQKPVPQTVSGSFQPNAWLQITPDNKVIFQLDKAEMGQGVTTSLPTIIGEALDYDPTKMIVEMAGVHPVYNNPAMGMQVTGGSTSVTTSWIPLSEAGATARFMLMAAAAKQWEVSQDELTTDGGYVVHEMSQRRTSYGDLAEAAKSISVPETITLKSKEDYQWVGKRFERSDSTAKINGDAKFGTDVVFPDMKVAVVVRCPHFGGGVKSFDVSEAKKIKGVKKIFEIYTGVAIIADGYWPARQAANVIKVEWNKGPLAGLSSADILSNQKDALDNAETIVDAVSEGDADAVWGSSQSNDDVTLIDVNYSAPFLHHSPMEPQNCTALVSGHKCELWAPSQAPGFVQALAAQYGGFDKENVTVHTTIMGGGFGRRAMTDFAGEAAVIAKEIPGIPVKLMWSREDDMRHDFYRPSTYHRVRGVVSSDGKIDAWRHRLVSASIIKGMAVTLVGSYMPTWLPEAMARGIGRFASNTAANRDAGMAEGAEIPYAVENKKVDIALYDPGVPLGFWRSVGHSHNAFVAESFMDEMAHAAQKDPVQFRLEYLKNHPRHVGVLKAVTEAAKWGSPQEGRFQGIAVHESFSSYVAEVVEVSKQAGGYKIERIVCAVDCGLVVNPDIVIDQIEGAVAYGLSGALKTPVHIEDGKVVQSNFHDLPVLRINEMPKIEVIVLESDEHPTGVGEIGLPPVAPALANALFNANGNRQRDLPLSLKS
ncbi:MAG: molybdopterin cofactor-binding domain-containing protein [Cellvibrionaceae bacterium]